MNWTGWPIERILLLLVGLVYLVIFVQVTLFHFRQNFHKKVMWIPVIETPIFGIVTILYICYAANWLKTTVAVMFWIAIVSGLIGSFYHIRGVGQRVDGYKLRNFLIGPPLTLPSLISVLGIFGLIAMYWG